MTDFSVVVPVLSIPAENGTIDQAATLRYATRAAATWVDALLISGSTAQGHLLSIDERAQLLDLWLTVADPHRLLACCWAPADLDHAAARGITPMAVLRGLPDRSAALDFLASLPPGSTIYSHPTLFDGQHFDIDLARAAAAGGVLPHGGKLAKVSTGDVAEIHTTAPDFRLWDGSSRRIAESLKAGASGIVATPLAAFDRPFPVRDVASIQQRVNGIQTVLDAMPTRSSRTAELLRRAES
jgi:hypothetical protein